MRFVASHQDAETTRKRAGFGECLIAEDASGRIIGTLTWYEPGPDPVCPLYREPDLAHFGQFGVEPSSQGAGTGRALLDEAERRAAARGYRRMACDTASPAAHLIAMYERWGYARCGTVRWAKVNYESVLLVKGIG